jgi:NAD(P)-dependent dehydrogenase (short-subunit alcohol dehydrogenase family)
MQKYILKDSVMQNRLDGQIALITGAGRGLGRSIAVALASEGATVILTARTQSQLNETAQQVESAGGKAEIVVADLNKEESIINLVSTVEQKFGRLDILVNNAGITLSAKLEETATADWDSVFSVNTRAPFILSREAIPLLSKSKAACIVNIGSVVSVKCYALQSAYTASKHALRGMTQALAEELRDTNLRVHLLCPGGIDTDMIGNIRPDIRKEDLMQTQEIAELVLYLVTHKGNAVIDELHIRRAASPPWF